MFANLTMPKLSLKLPNDTAAAVGRLMLVNKEKLVSVVTAMQLTHVKYHLGSKAASLTSAIADISKIDCSGFARYALYQATSGMVRLPDGSWNQDDWFKTQGYAVTSYQKTAGTLDNRLRIAFMHGAIGHVWFVLNGLTMESRGHVGPSRRDWHTPVLFTHATKCYVLTA